MKPVKESTKAKVLAQASEQAAMRAAAEARRIEDEELKIDINQSGARIKMPRHFSLQNLQRFSDALWICRQKKDVEIDFVATNVFQAESLLFIHHQIKCFNEDHPQVGVHVINHRHISFAKTMGMLRMFGSGPTLSVAGSQKKLHYLPISTITAKEFLQKAGINNVRDMLDSETMRLAKLLVRKESGYAVDVVQFGLREIIRNVFEHSGAKFVSYCAHYWEESGKVQVSIVDNGSGIHPSLTFNPKYRELTPRQAVQWALLPGVSGNFRDLQFAEVDNIWRNSGYGLYMTSQMCGNAGSFRIISSGVVITLYEGQKQILPMNNFKGTMITMTIQVNVNRNLSEDLKRYAEEGKQKARDITGAKVIEASAASQMLSRDFSRSKR